MYVDADAREASLREHDEHEGALWKMADDPRVTPIGRFIRRYSFDELPQLLNVIAGDDESGRARAPSSSGKSTPTTRTCIGGSRSDRG